MLVYLDQNHIIDLTKNKYKLDSLFRTMQGKGAKLGVSFFHIVETSIFNKKNRDDIIKVIEKLGYIQITPVLKILDTEVKNEFYRYLKLKENIKKVDAFQPIFENRHKNSSFNNIVKEFCLDNRNIEHSSQLRASHVSKIKSLLTKGSVNLKKEREALLDNYIDTRLIPTNVDLKIALLPKSLDAKDFKKYFDWTRCPYLSFYVLFQSLRYLDRKRKNLTGDLADLEHATIGSLSCDLLCIEKHACEIINQIQQRRDTKIKAIVFNNLSKLIEFLGGKQK